MFVCLPVVWKDDEFTFEATQCVVYTENDCLLLPLLKPVKSAHKRRVCLSMNGKHTTQTNFTPSLARRNRDCTYVTEQWASFNVPTGRMCPVSFVVRMGGKGNYFP